jgi:hypothetical protein
MAVCFTDGDPTGDWSRDEVTAPQGSRRRSKPAAPVSDPGLGLAVASEEEPLPGPAPAALSPSGGWHPLPGVERDVTGMYMVDDGEERTWFAAFGGRARGPFSTDELALLAKKGRVRASTLVWRPGFTGWKRVRCRNESVEQDLRWLRTLVRARRRHEQGAANLAEEQGISALRLSNADFEEPRRTPPPVPDDDSHASMPPKPPAPPRVLFLGRKMPDAFAADRVFGEPALGETSVREETLVRERRRYRQRMFFFGAALTALGLIAVGFTLPALGVETSPLLDPFFRVVAALLPG